MQLLSEYKFIKHNPFKSPARAVKNSCERKERVKNMAKVPVLQSTFGENSVQLPMFTRCFNSRV